ncbi:hypothetical protein HAX54_038837 [Datura stramonium]|uniref:Uncharacterized protein n=1 Tax=Datura stramonium TaxID=4076 RepID=A0ABS8VLQ0_DATST|nr:hypothetical protein [Datura stramonium]
MTVWTGSTNSLSICGLTWTRQLQDCKRYCETNCAEQIPKYKIDSVDFETLTLGSLPPTFQGMKVYVTDEKELIMEPSIVGRNPNVTVRSKHWIESNSSGFAAPRITLKPLVPSFPCFANIFVSLMEKLGHQVFPSQFWKTVSLDWKQCRKIVGPDPFTESTITREPAGVEDPMTITAIFGLNHLLPKAHSFCEADLSPPNLPETITAIFGLVTSFKGSFLL